MNTVNSASLSQATPSGAQVRPPARHSFFRQLLSEMNPLQYVPMAGTIYRAVTGDTIPETARLAGSLVVSGLTGGPAGVAMNIGATLLERATGIDPEAIGQRVLGWLGIGKAPSPSKREPAPERSRQRPATASPWSAAQLRAYGVTSTADGTLQRAASRGADVLNGLELARLAGARSALSTLA